MKKAFIILLTIIIFSSSFAFAKPYGNDMTVRNGGVRYQPYTLHFRAGIEILDTVQIGDGIDELTAGYQTPAAAFDISDDDTLYILNVYGESSKIMCFDKNNDYLGNITLDDLGINETGSLVDLLCCGDSLYVKYSEDFSPKLLRYSIKERKTEMYIPLFDDQQKLREGEDQNYYPYYNNMLLLGDRLVLVYDFGAKALSYSTETDKLTDIAYERVFDESKQQTTLTIEEKSYVIDAKGIDFRSIEPVGITSDGVLIVQVNTDNETYTESLRGYKCGASECVMQSYSLTYNHESMSEHPYRMHNDKPIEIVSDSYKSYICSADFAVEYLAGDMNDIDGDGAVNTSDAVCILRGCAMMYSLEGSRESLKADVDGNGKLNTADAVLILKYAAGMITQF